MTSHCFSLRRAAVACIRQVSQKDADNLCDFMAAAAMAATAASANSGFIGCLPGETPSASAAATTTTGSLCATSCESVAPLEAVLFSLLDVETDAKLRGHLEEAISSLLQARALSHFQDWMKSLKQLLQVRAFSTSPLTNFLSL